LTTIWEGLELRHLLAARAVAEAGSFGRAAERLGYTQSAVSQQIAVLEAILGERLFERSRGQPGVEPTEAGRLLLRHAAAVLARLEAARADFAAFRAGDGGALRVGTYQSVSTRVLPALIRRFTDAWPRVEVRLVESPPDELLPQVERGELDLTFDALPLAEGPFEAVEVLRDPYVLLVPRDSPLATAGRAPSPAEIGALPLVGYHRHRSIAQVEGQLRGIGADPRIVFRTDDNGAVQGLVAAGLGAAVVPRLAMDPRDDAVVALPLDGLLEPRRLCLAWHRDRYHSPAARAFIETAMAVCREASAAADPPSGPMG
jgi:DNA-binding transcriptional LysR family regulator